MAKTKINLQPVRLPRCHGEWPVKVGHAFRERLRGELGLIMHDVMHGKPLKNIDLDAAVEQAWNAAVVASGHDNRNPSK